MLSVYLQNNHKRSFFCRMWVMNVIAFDSLPSTNDYAQDNLNTLNHKDVITAETQSRGKGRMQRVWLSPKGGLYFTVVLKPALKDTAVLSSLTQAMALAVCKTVKGQGINAYLKWPNDVLCSGKKFCGILSRAVFEENSLSAILIGTGINVEPAVINCGKPSVTLKELGLKIEKEELLKLVLNNFDTLQDTVLARGFAAIRQQFKDNFPYIGQQVNINAQQQNIKGTASDIDNLGRLLIQTPNGIITVNMGDMDF